jgi:hypothetical protein
MIPDHNHFQIGSLIFEDMDQIDVTGPFEVFSRLPNSTYRLYGPTTSPLRDMHELRLLAEARHAGQTLAARRLETARRTATRFGTSEV